MKVYDKVSWHFPEGKNCPSLEAAQRHLKVIMAWLAENKLLSPEGNELLELGVGSDFSLHSGMLSEKGNNILQKHYSEWLKNIDYSSSPDLSIFKHSLEDC